MHANDDEPSASEVLGCMPDDLESVRAWLLVELAEDDVDQEVLLRDLAVCNARIASHRPAAAGKRPVLHCVS